MRPPLALLDARPGFAIALSGMAAFILLAAFVVHLQIYSDLQQRIGIDYAQYTTAAMRWLSGGSFYQPWQLSGPYTVPRDEFDLDRLPVLYPPTAIPLFAVFGLARVAEPLWWVIPIVLVLIVVRGFRPAPWTWPLITLCVLSADTMWLAISGNPVLWVAAAVALGTRFGWPFVGVLLKPSVGPIALLGLRHRSWWIAAGCLVAVSAVFLPIWPDYATALLNERGVSWLYSANNLPMLAIPILAWLGRRRVPPPLSLPRLTPQRVS